MLKRKGQNIAEDSILIALVIAAAVAMQVYIKRGIQARVADAVDYAPNTKDVGGAPLAFTGEQYEPYYVSSDGNVASQRHLSEGVTEKGATAWTVTQDETRRIIGAKDTTLWSGIGAR